MSRDWWLRRAAAGMLAATLMGATLLGGASGVSAQATPESGQMATPASGECTALDVAMPDAEVSTPAMEGTPAAEDGPVGTPISDQATADAAFAAAENLANCWNAGDLESVLTLVTPNLLESKFGVASAEEAATALGAMEPLPMYAIVSVDSAQTYEDGRASIDIDYMLGHYQYTSARWYMVMAGDALLIDEEELLLPQPEGDTTVASFSIADDTTPVIFDQSTEIAASPVVVLHGINNGTERHVFQIVRLADDFAGTPAAGEVPEGGEYVAMLSVAGGAQEDVALVAPPAGTYVVFDPAVEGSAAALVITEPAA